MLKVGDVDGKVPFKTRDVDLDERWDCISLWANACRCPVQDVGVDVNFCDVLLEVARSKVPVFDVVLLPEDVEDDVEVVLAFLVIILLVADVDRVDGQDDADILGSPTVLDVQGDV